MATPQMIRKIIADIRNDIDGPLDEAIAALQRFKSKFEADGYTNLAIDVDAYSDYGEPSVSVEISGTRMETESEAERRENVEIYRVRETEHYERQQYEQLKAKFG